MISVSSHKRRTKNGIVNVNQYNRSGNKRGRKRKFGFSFSGKRAVGLSGLKNKISKKLGIPLTTSGFQRMVGRKLLHGFHW